MSAVAAVRAILVGNAALTALVPAGRITAGEIPQGSAWPALVVYHDETKRLGGAEIAAGAEKLVSVVVVIVAAETYAALTSLSEQYVTNAVHGAHGLYAGAQVHQVLRTRIGRDAWNPDVGIWEREVEIEVIFTRPV